MTTNCRRLLKKIIYGTGSTALFFLIAVLIYNTYVGNSIHREETDIKKNNQLFYQYHHHGHSPAILLLHGYGGSPVDIKPLADSLRNKGYAFYIITLPGHGTSPRDLHKTKAREWLTKAFAAYEELKQKYPRVSVVGFSMGGAIAAIIAAEKEVDKLVLISPYFKSRKRWFYILNPTTWAGLLHKIVPFVKKLKIGQINSPEGIKKYNGYRHLPLTTVEELQKIGNLAREKSKAIHCDTLWLHSTGDVVADFRMSLEVFRGIPAKRKYFKEYARSNHIILYDYDGPDAVKKIISFLVGDKHGDTNN